MNERTLFIIKILFLSTLISVVIKYGGRFLPIPPTTLTALILVLLPTIIIAFALIWRNSQSSSSV
jgi:hypothetical protein